MKLKDQIVTDKKLAQAMDCDEETLAKAVETVEAPYIATDKGGAEFFYGDAFQVYASEYLRKKLKLTPKQVKTLMEKNDITFSNGLQVVRLYGDDFLAVKLRLRKLRGAFLTAIEK